MRHLGQVVNKIITESNNFTQSHFFPETKTMKKKTATKISSSLLT